MNLYSLKSLHLSGALMLLFVLQACVSTQQVTDQVSEPNQAEVGSREIIGAPMPISGLGTVFDDALTQWDVFDFNGERAGELRLRYPPFAGQGGDFTQWTFRMGDFEGSVKPKFTGRLDVWEVRVGNEITTARVVFPNQLDEWAIQNGNSRIVFTVRDYRLLEFWSTRGPGDPGRYEVFTRYEGDPRDWEIIDELTKPVTPAAQLAMIWLPVYMRLSLQP